MIIPRKQGGRLFLSGTGPALVPENGGWTIIRVWEIVRMNKVYIILLVFE